MIPLIGIRFRKKEAQESVSVTVHLSEASRIALLCWTATQKPTLVYAISASGNIPHGTSSRKQDNYITTGIYHCPTLDRE